MVGTAETPYVTSFEDADQSSWTLINGNDNTRFDSPAYDGSIGWRTDGNHPYEKNTEFASYPGDGLGTYPEPGDRIRIFGNALTSGGSTAILFPANGHFDTYRASFTPSTVYARNISTGKTNTTSIPASSNTWYELVVDWFTDGDFTARVLDTDGTELRQVSMGDTTYSSGNGIGLRWGPDGEQHTFDLLRIEKDVNP